MKREFKARYYIRYCDDFVIVSDDALKLRTLIPCIGDFLLKRLCLSLHPRKVSIRKVKQGVDFLGYLPSEISCASHKYETTDVSAVCICVCNFS